MLDERSFIETLWTHRPITDVWNIGPGITRRLAQHGVHDLKGVAELDRRILYKEFGANAEYLIDHAWGQEPCTIADIKNYVPKEHSTVNGQVLPCDYSAEDARLVMHEMIDASVLDLVRPIASPFSWATPIAPIRKAADPIRPPASTPKSRPMTDAP